MTSSWVVCCYIVIWDFKDFVAVQNEQIHKYDTNIDTTQFNCKAVKMNIMIFHYNRNISDSPWISNCICLFLAGVMANPCLTSLQWRHNGRDSVSNHQPRDCLLSRLFRRRSEKTTKLRVTGLCVRNSPVTSEFPAQMASNAENVSIWWRHHV